MRDKGNRMTYLINDIFYTIQGEGYWTGRPAVFCRFSRCNLWTGREEDRATAICKFCDTDFLHGERLDLQTVLGRIDEACEDNPMVVFTGGEPTLQLDRHLINALHNRGHYLAIETNGTRRLPDGLDWVCVSPKAKTTVVVDRGDELKIVFPQDMDVEWWHDNTHFDHYWLSPMDGTKLEINTKLAVHHVRTHPWWRLNIQTHKVIGVP